MTQPVEIVEANLDREDHQQAVRQLTSSYAADPMGNGSALPDDVLDRLVPGLRAMPTSLIFLAYFEGKPVGIATCFRGFSTFLALPLINIHDLAVLPEYRGHGIGKSLLLAVDEKARELGCGRVTLEVQSNNTRAKSLYEAIGFAQAVYGDNTGGSLFFTKRL